mmetsp:Transcript_16839/g.47053  ORF Transcript_16839/g.47053 Transcript_16839/m.47053 type:complete len:204 (+) Transcript_16839:2408-3019(+)
MRWKVSRSKALPHIHSRVSVHAVFPRLQYTFIICKFFMASLGTWNEDTMTMSSPKAFISASSAAVGTRLSTLEDTLSLPLAEGRLLEWSSLVGRTARVPAPLNRREPVAFGPGDSDWTAGDGPKAFSCLARSAICSVANLLRSAASTMGTCTEKLGTRCSFATGRCFRTRRYWKARIPMKARWNVRLARAMLVRHSGVLLGKP